MMVGRGSRFVRDPVRQARLDWRYSTLRTHRSVESRTSERAAACACLSLSLFPSCVPPLFSFPLNTPVCFSLTLFLALPLSVSSFLSRFTFTLSFISLLVAPIHLAIYSAIPPLRSLLRLPTRCGIDRLRLLSVHERIPFCVYLPLALSRSRTPPTSCSSPSRPRPRSTTYDAAGRNTERVRVWSKARHSRQHALAGPATANITCQTQWTRIKPSIASVERHDVDVPPSTAITRPAISLSRPEINEGRSRPRVFLFLSLERVDGRLPTLSADDPYLFVQDPLLSLSAHLPGRAARSIFIA